MDETLRELVSRYIDGDLDDVESARLEKRARNDAGLAEEIDTARELRGAVSMLADRMEPPASLDRVMEPIRQSAPAVAPRVRPAFRWLGAAAAVVLGVTVTVEMARRNPEPSLSRPSPSRQRPAQQRDEIFELAPLPTANPDERRPLGAAEHLLEEEPALPTAPEPAPLEVMGPLPTSDREAVADTAPESLTDRTARDEAPVDTGKSIALPAPAKRAKTETRTATVGEARVAPEGVGGSRADKDGEVASRQPDSGKSRQSSAHGGRQSTVIPVVLRVNGVEVWSGSTTSCPEGVLPVRIVIRDKKVVSLEIVPGEAENSAGPGVEDCRPDGLIGSVAPGLDDDTHDAEIVVGAHAPQ